LQRPSSLNFLNYICITKKTNMSKFLKISASTTGVVLVGLENIDLVVATATTVVLSYSAGSTSTDVVTITHTSDSTFATRDAIYAAIELANSSASNPAVFITPQLPTGITVSTVAVA
jgi:hypothetical protein